MADLRGRALGNYQIVEEIGRGGMAIVYRAFQPSLNRHVAIKVLPLHLTFDQEFVVRFEREAKAAAQLNHPNIVHIYDTGEADGHHYIVMEYLTGQTLGQLIEREGALAPTRVVHIAGQLASALDYAHQLGVVHRDVKPANIFVGQGDHVTLTDFGIAKAATETQHLTRTGAILGTPEYMSPEQAEGRAVDYRTDLYALGVVLYQMLTGRVPFHGTTPHATLHAVIYEPPPRPRQLNPRLPTAFEAVILRAVAKRPEQRYQRGAQLTAALQAALAGKAQPAAVQPASPLMPPTRPQRRTATSRGQSPLVLILVALAAIAVLLLGGLWLLVLRVTDGTQPTPTTTEALAAATATQAAFTLAPSPGTATVATATAPDAPTIASGTDTPMVSTVEPTPLPATDTALPPTSTATLPTSTAAAPSNTPVPPTATLLPPTDTPKPPTATPTPACTFEAQGLFAGLWQNYRIQLGCPLHPAPKVIQDAEQVFERGHMFWRADNDYAYVVYEQGGRSGSFESFAGMWSEGDPEYSCSALPPAGRVQPKRGFGAVWCQLGGASAAIGWGMADERGFGPGNGDPLVQDFQRGLILRDSDGQSQGLVYLLFQDGTFLRTGY